LHQAQGEILRHAHPSLLEFVPGIGGYVPPPVVQSVIGTPLDDTGHPGSSPIRPVVKGNAQPNFSWVDPSASLPPPPAIRPGGGSVYGQFGSPERLQTCDLGQGSAPMEQPGISVAASPNLSSIMAQPGRTFGYPSELNGDGTWQQLMVQLGVMEGQN